MTRAFIALFLAFLLGTPTLGFADDGTPVLTPKRVKKSGRRLASVEESRSSSQLRVSNPTTRKEEQWDLRIGVIGGFSTLSSNDKDGQGVPSNGISDSNFLGGIQADLKAWKYFGAELEGFFATGGKHEVDTGGEATYKSYAVMINVNGQLPFRTGSIRWVPKLGLGYGFVNYKGEVDSGGAGGTSTDNASLSGPYGTVGFDVEVGSWLGLVDYAHSVAAKGTYNITGAAVTTFDQDLDSTSYGRFRLGVMYQFTQHFVAGVQGALRSASFTLPGSVERSISQTQFLGVFFYRF